MGHARSNLDLLVNETSTATYVPQFVETATASLLPTSRTLTRPVMMATPKTVHPALTHSIHLSYPVGDGCSADCKDEELGWSCIKNIIVGDQCSPKCGDGLTLGDEECDIGSTDMVGCSSECKVLPGYSCTKDENGPDTCMMVCAGGTIQCNDGNGVDGITFSHIFFSL